MMTVFKQIPAPLLRQTLIRVGFGAAFFALTLALLIAVRDVYAWLPGAGAAVFCAAAAFSLFRRTALGEYVAVGGTCCETGLTAVKRRAKYILLQTEERTIRVSLHGRVKPIPVGTALCLYLAKNTPVYEIDGLQHIYSYLALEIK